MDAELEKLVEAGKLTAKAADQLEKLKPGTFCLHKSWGFGRIADLTPEQLLTDISDAASLLEAEQGAIEHMNADHRDAMNLYATRLLGAEPGDWCCTGCDPDGIDMQAGAITLRLDFARRIVTPAALRQVLKQLADRARTVDPGQPGLSAALE